LNVTALAVEFLDGLTGVLLAPQNADPDIGGAQVRRDGHFVNRQDAAGLAAIAFKDGPELALHELVDPFQAL
jgi:hypothetical protein